MITVHQHLRVTSTCSNQRQGSRCHLQQGNPLQTRVDGQTERQQQSALQDTAAIAGNAMAVDRWWRQDLFLGDMGRHGRWAWRFGARRHDWRCTAGIRERRSRSHAPMFVSGRMDMTAPDRNVFFAVAMQLGPHADPPACEPFAPRRGRSGPRSRVPGGQSNLQPSSKSRRGLRGNSPAGSP